MNPSSSTIRFMLDGDIHEINPAKLKIRPSTTVLDYLRSLDKHRGVKEGCREGDCGACTVVVAEPGPGDKLLYKAVNSCLMFLPMLHGKQLITIENLKQLSPAGDLLHPVQQAMVDYNGIQCGYCTPGMVMSLFALYKGSTMPDDEEIKEALAGNLCRCTGYRSILEAARQVCRNPLPDKFTEEESRVYETLKNISGREEVLLFRGEDQTYMMPFTLEQTLSLKAAHPEATITSGATDVAFRQSKTRLHANLLLDLSHLEELKFYFEDHSHWFVGAGLPLEELKDIAAERIPSLYSVLKVFASRQIRNLATLAGNIATASPIGDTLPWLLVMNARVHLMSQETSRVVPLEKFITAYRQTDLHPDEIITMVSIPKPDPSETIRYYKISNRKDVDISSVSGAIRMKMAGDTIEKFGFVLGGVAAMPFRAITTENFLAGKKWSKDTIKKAMISLHEETNPISDARSDAEARKLLAGNLLLKFWSDPLSENGDVI